MPAVDVQQEQERARDAARGGREKRSYVRAMFSDIAPSYDFLNHLLSFNIDRRWRRRALQGLSWEQAPAGSFAPTSVLLIGLGVTGGLATGAFAVQMWVQQFVPAQQVALVFASEPAYAAWLSWYFLGETLDFQGWVGSALILLAVVIGAFESRKQAPADKMAQSA